MENTLAAFENSINNGIKYLELDVHLTKDNVVIIAHDFDLSRVCHLDPSSPKHIGEYDFVDLPPFRINF